MKSFEYFEPATLDEAVGLLAAVQWQHKHSCRGNRPPGGDQRKFAAR